MVLTTHIPTLSRPPSSRPSPIPPLPNIQTSTNPCTGDIGKPYRDAEHVRVAVHPRTRHVHHNSFDSGFRDTVNGTAITNLVVPITDNSTIWFFDVNTCARGGVGGINVNDSSTETLDGFRVSPSVFKLYGSCSLER